jgi:hypothetical protein
MFNSKVDNIIRDNRKGTGLLRDNAFLAHRNVIKKETEKILKYKDLTTEMRRMRNVKKKSESDTVTNSNDGNRLKILRKIPEQRTGKARYQGTAENSYIVYSTHTAESANVEAQSICHGT